MANARPRDLMATLMEGDLPPRVPYALNGAPQAFWRALEAEIGRPLGEVYHLDNGTRGASPRQLGRNPWDSPFDNPPNKEDEEALLKERFARYLPAERPAGLRVSEYGAISVPGSSYHFRRLVYPLERATRLSEIDDFPWPDYTEEWRWEGVEAQTKELLKQGYWVEGGVGHFFEQAWFVRGQEQLLVDAYENPEFLDHLLDRVAQSFEYRAARLASYGVDSLRCGDDLGHQYQLFMRPKMLRKWILSRWERIIGAAKAIKPDIKVDFHTDGRCQEMIPDLMAIGVNAINPVQPECDDPDHLKRTFGRKLVLKGITSNAALTFGTPDDVRADVKRCVDTAKRWGGIMVTNQNGPDVNTPMANFRAFLDACEEYTLAS